MKVLSFPFAFFLRLLFTGGNFILGGGEAGGANAIRERPAICLSSHYCMLHVTFVKSVHETCHFTLFLKAKD